MLWENFGNDNPALIWLWMWSMVFGKGKLPLRGCSHIIWWYISIFAKWFGWYLPCVILHLYENQSIWTIQFLVLCSCCASVSVSSILMTDVKHRRKYHKKNLRNAAFVQKLLLKTEVLVSSVIQMLLLCGFAKKKGSTQPVLSTDMWIREAQNMKFFPRQCSLGLDEVRKPREMQKAGQVAEGSDGGRIRKKSENYAKC